jgi:hypothetical protein
VASFDKVVKERGSALLVALALLALAAALLAGSAQAGRAIARSADSYGASITAEFESRAALADFLSAWSSSYDSLKVGASLEAEIAPRRVGSAGLVASARVRLMRLSASRYVVGLESVVGAPGLSMSRRRLTLIVERPLPSDSLAERKPPAPITRWSLTDLF